MKHPFSEDGVGFFFWLWINIPLWLNTPIFLWSQWNVEIPDIENCMVSRLGDVQYERGMGLLTVILGWKPPTRCQVAKGTQMIFLV